MFFFNEVRALFERLFRFELLVSHGTLFGAVREGDFIEGDDDFDCVYISEHSDLTSIVQERNSIHSLLMRQGYNVKVGVTGHLKLRNEHVEIDIMPAWFVDDIIYISSFSRFECRKDKVLPPSKVFLSTYEVPTFNDPEFLLINQYGVNWRQPDPHFKYGKDDVRKEIRKVLAGQ